jgi:LacI family transcriptional regulator
MAKIKRKKRPTQTDVAQLAGVSQTTVSHVLNNTDIAVPTETRQRILQAMEELGYVPNITARSLRTNKTYTIAGIIPDITNPFYPAFERGIQDVAEEHGYDLIMYNTNGDLKKEQKCLRSVWQRRVDGVVAVLFNLTAKDLLPLLDMNIAVVRLEATKKEAGEYPLDNLYVDNVAAAHRAVDYLISKGHTRIGIIVGERGPGKFRELGYRQALTRHNIALDETLIRQADFAEKGGYQSMTELLELSPLPTAVFAANDLMAAGALMAIKQAGLRVPDDIAVIGFDNIPMAKLLTPALTTIAQRQEQLGRRAAEMLFERLSGAAPETGRCEEMPYSLIIRESV